MPSKGGIPWNKGRKETRPEVLEKMGLAHIGNKYNLGRKMTEEEKLRKSEYAKAHGYGKWMKGKKASDETRRKISEHHKKNGVGKWLGKKEPWNKGLLGVQKGLIGEKCHFWKGGVTRENELVRKSAKTRLWRESVYSRDNWTCQECFVKGGELHAHHIKQFAFYQELRFEVSNGVTLCKDCHKKIPVKNR